MKCIPAIDLFEGSVVRLYKGDYEQVTRYPKRPREYAQRLLDAGLDTLHVVDLNAARGDETDNERIVTELAGIEGLDVQVGGGVRNEERLTRMLEAGASRVVIGSVAVNEPERVAEWMNIFGPERIVPALDVRFNDAGEPEALVQGWQEGSKLSLWELLDIYRPAGMQYLLCTDVERDGTMDGPNLDLYREVLERIDEVELQASGGVSSMHDLRDLKTADVPAVIIGKAWLDARLDLEELQRFA
ncbi:MAG: 1-(5-phosphoribosyl)-5-[(5-phosphoribosylamino)methylideneamino]imidazole-4-carboxamide isomerase [Gammaproteobacteria bacterium]|nr:1-(5-phosphoribosyl)-5-[(5-phosphoribosylamino)methylideneamino]imidazole-4-carboxamide isomerase [Gammaproteobacteria bacterium]